MNDENKKLISHEKLFQLVCEWLKPFIDEQIRLGGYWSSSLNAGSFYWNLAYSIDDRGRVGSSRLCDNHWEIYNRIYQEEKYINIRIFNDHIEFIEDSFFKDFSKEEMYSLYTFLNERIFNNKENKEVENVTDQDDSNNKHVYILAIDACIDLPTYTFLIKAANKDEAFEIFWNRYKDFPEADIDREFGASDLCDDGSSIQRLHREKFVRIDENTMESTEEIFSTTSIRLCDAPKCVHIDDDITYIQEVY